MVVAWYWWKRRRRRTRKVSRRCLWKFLRWFAALCGGFCGDCSACFVAIFYVVAVVGFLWILLWGGVNGDGDGAILLVLEIVTWTVTCDLSYDVGCELVTCDFGGGGAIFWWCWLLDVTVSWCWCWYWCGRPWL